MIHKLKTFGVFYLILISSFSVVSAKTADSTSYFYTKYESEKELTYIPNVLKTDVYSIAEGDLPIILEHRFSDRFTLEGGVGVLLPYTSKFLSLGAAAELNSHFTNTQLGYSFLMEPKLFYKYKTELYQCFIVRYRHYNQLLISEYGYGNGAEFCVGKFIIDPTLLITFSWQKPLGSDGEYKYYNSVLSESGSGKQAVFRITLSIKFGYAIKQND